MQELLHTIESFILSGVDEVLADKGRNLIQDRALKNKQVEEKIIITNDNNHFKTIESKLVENLSCTSEVVSQARKLADNTKNLIELKSVIDNFDGCRLKKTATNLVFSDGNKDSDIMLIGEAPGASEDQQGIPFCGVSGKLLDDIFRAIGCLRSHNLYITNSVFWRPPGNRRPTEEEISICRPFLEKHISLINPKIVILVGSTSVSSLMPNITDTISNIRGKEFKYKNKYLEQEISLIPIFHPSYLLRQPAKKRQMFDDIIKIKTQFLDKKLT